MENPQNQAGDTKVVGALEKDNAQAQDPPKEPEKNKDDSYDEMVEPTFWETKGVRWILSLLFMACLALNFVFFFKESEHETWHQWIIVLQALFFATCYTFTCIIPLPLLILDLLPFTNYRFG